jgi:hypothetical protein
MPDEPTVPEFHLPDWGTEGAPPIPAVPPDEGPPPREDRDEVEISVERSMLLTTGPLPLRWQIDTVHGLVTAHGQGDEDDFEIAVRAATDKALADLQEAARGMDASAVTDIRLTATAKKSKVVVTATGTAVSFSL